MSDAKRTPGPKHTPGSVAELVDDAWHGCGERLHALYLKRAEAFDARPVLDEEAVAALREWLEAMRIGDFKAELPLRAKVTTHLRRLLPEE